MKRDGFRLFAVMTAVAETIIYSRLYFRRWLVRFKLGAHFLDLSCLLFELRRENLHPFLLQGDGRFQVSDTGLLLPRLFCAL